MNRWIFRNSTTHSLSHRMPKTHMKGRNKINPPPQCWNRQLRARLFLSQHLTVGHIRDSPFVFRRHGAFIYSHSAECTSKVRKLWMCKRWPNHKDVRRPLDDPDCHVLVENFIDLISDIRSFVVRPLDICGLLGTEMLGVAMQVGMQIRACASRLCEQLPAVALRLRSGVRVPNIRRRTHGQD